MKKLMLITCLVLVIQIPAYGILGLGIGLHGGTTSGYEYKVLDGIVDEIATELQLGDITEFDSQLTVIGGHLKLATIPFIDFSGFVDYAWTSKDIGPDVKFKLHDLSIGISAKKLFGVAIVKPYIGAGGALHALAYSIETDLINATFPVPDEKQSKFGMHFIGGVELDFPVFPLTPYLEGQYNIITTDEESTKYVMINGGLTMNF